MKAALRMTFVTLLMFGAMYPLLVTLIARVIAPNRGEGEEVTVQGTAVGFELIGQRFDEGRYFSSRPSAVDYNAAATGGSNKGPSNADYLQQVRSRVDSFLKYNPSVRKKDIPVDMITASGSGLDPHISVQAAMVQIDRIARIRNIDSRRLAALVEENTVKPFGGLGVPCVHVLRLNLALDKLK